MQNEKLRPANGLRGLCLIQDNAHAHKCVLVQDFLKEEKVIQLSHPPYSPDLSPCNFFLFPLLKKTFLVVNMNPEVHLVVQFTSVFRVYLKRPTSLPLQNEFRDLKSVFPSRENTLKG